MSLYTQQATVDAQGNVTLTFNAPGFGSTLTGTLTVTSGSNGATWTVLNNGVPVTATIGSTPVAAA